MAIVDNAFREWIAEFKAINPSVADNPAILDTAQYAFAAGRKAQREIDASRQPVGQVPAFYLYSSDWRSVRVPMTPSRGVRVFRHGFDHADPEDLVPFYAAPPAQAVDLGQFRPAVECLKSTIEDSIADAKHMLIATGALDSDLAEVVRLLALIDSKAVGNGTDR
ncbi:hypothetical protein [Ancylobacter oerskovii]|uniref:Uncharacterized protein n=1 Tax=Ancylobacter oerskovii TaxID=459519 RepID=A0ABW4Z5W5_9HYPH|nr:hypothetical protein [Ancylobacter oerskovii]MBS7545561.1 hypothetical protein [Ancylobacter oerskovii]